MTDKRGTGKITNVPLLLLCFSDWEGSECLDMMTLKSVKWLSPQVDRRIVHQDRVTAFRFSPFRYNISRRTIGVMCLPPIF
jgi:hypothetical protein